MLKSPRMVNWQLKFTFRWLKMIAQKPEHETFCWRGKGIENNDREKKVKNQPSKLKVPAEEIKLQKSGVNGKMGDIGEDITFRRKSRMKQAIGVSGVGGMIWLKIRRHNKIKSATQSQHFGTRHEWECLTWVPGLSGSTRTKTVSHLLCLIHLWYERTGNPNLRLRVRDHIRPKCVGRQSLR